MKVTDRTINNQCLFVELYCTARITREIVNKA
jgi:hypothetical protein